MACFCEGRAIRLMGHGRSRAPSLSIDDCSSSTNLAALSDLPFLVGRDLRHEPVWRLTTTSANVMREK